MPGILTAVGTVYVHFADYAPPLADGECKVIDGDTVIVGGQRWRLEGIDAPSIGGRAHCPDENALGMRAKARLEQLLAEGARRSCLHVDILDLGEKYKRKLVRIFVDGVDVRETLISEGLAQIYDGHGSRPVFCQCSILMELRRLMEEDQAEREASRRSK